MKFSLLIPLLFFTLCAAAQQNYDASLISKQLLPYASAVVRSKQENIEVKDANSTFYHIKEAVTILNKNGDDNAEIAVYHDKITSIKYIKGAVYNSAGIQTAKFSEGDFEDVNTTDGFSLFEDVKVKHYKPVVNDYPYTIEFEYETKSKQSLYFEDWQPNAETGVAVENSSFIFTCKPDFNIRYKEINQQAGVNIGTTKDGLKTYTWQVTNLKAVRDEPYSPNPEKYLSSVKFAPEKFEYSGISGSFTNWDQLGKWIYDKLLINRNQLPPTAIEHIKDLTNGITDPKAKARKIFEYMQGKTHYVSVQVGIGGFQPFTATDVDQLNYGDCKALVNYTQALLKVADIDSYYCVVMAGRERKISLLSDFASMNQADHIILCIPFKNDTTWCDCTSQTIPFGYLGDFTDDRTVLACPPEGGKLMHTPKFTAANNLEKRVANFVLNKDGDLTGDMKTTFRGAEYDNREGINDESPKDQVKIMQKIYSINNLNIQKLEFKQDKGLQPVMTENIELEAPEYASLEDGKINFYLNTANRMYKAPRDVMNRKTDVYINEGYTDEDEVTYTLPAGYHTEGSHLNKSLKTAFGTFTATSTVEDGKLIYKRKLQVNDGTYPKDSYQDLVDFYQSVVDADAFRVTLVKD